MKSGSISLLCALLLTSFAFPATHKNSLENENLKGPVQSYTAIAFKAVVQSGKICKGERTLLPNDPTYEKLTNYDENGLETSLLRYFRKNKKPARWEFRYDKRGNRMQSSNYNKDGSLHTRYNIKFDKQGNKIRENKFEPGNPAGMKHTHTQWDYEYNQEGQIIAEHIKRSNGSKTRGVFTYDERGNRVRQQWYDEKDKPAGLGEFHYDAKGRVVEKIFTPSTGFLDSRTTYRYDSLGNKLEETAYNKDGNIYRKYRYQYVYDTHDNWIQMIRYDKNEKPEVIVERKITYYP